MIEDAIKWLIYEPAKATVTRIIPELATEIGLNESIVLLQISFWISTSNNVRDGKYWTYQTMKEMQTKAFPYWSVDTIRRTVHSLRDMGYLLIGSYNKRKGDNTQWFALEPDKISSLRSIIIVPFEDYLREGKTQFASTPLQFASTPLQDRTTLPEITTESTQNKKLGANKSRSKSVAIPAAQMNPMKDAIAAAFEWAAPSKSEWGKIQSAAKTLIESDVCAEDVKSLYAHCKAKLTDFGPTALPNHVSDWRKAQPKPAPPPAPASIPTSPFKKFDAAFEAWQAEQDVEVAS